MQLAPLLVRHRRHKLTRRLQPQRLAPEHRDAATRNVRGVARLAIPRRGAVRPPHFVHFRHLWHARLEPLQQIRLGASNASDLRQHNHIRPLATLQQEVQTSKLEVARRSPRHEVIRVHSQMPQFLASLLQHLDMAIERLHSCRCTAPRLPRAHLDSLLPLRGGLLLHLLRVGLKCSAELAHIDVKAHIGSLVHLEEAEPRAIS